MWGWIEKWRLYLKMYQEKKKKKDRTEIMAYAY